VVQPSSYPGDDPAVFYLFVVYQPNGPETTDVFAVKYKYLMSKVFK
jgi:hypothetical protein